MKKVISLILMTIMALGLFACTQPTQLVGGNVLQSNKQRVTSPVASQTDLATLVNGNNAFAFNLYQLCTLKKAKVI